MSSKSKFSLNKKKKISKKFSNSLSMFYFRFTFLLCGTEKIIFEVLFRLFTNVRVFIINGFFLPFCLFKTKKKLLKCLEWLLTFSCLTLRLIRPHNFYISTCHAHLSRTMNHRFKWPPSPSSHLLENTLQSLPQSHDLTKIRWGYWQMPSDRFFRYF